MHEARPRIHDDLNVPQHSSTPYLTTCGNLWCMASIHCADLPACCSLNSACIADVRAAVEQLEGLAAAHGLLRGLAHPGVVAQVPPPLTPAGRHPQGGLGLQLGLRFGLCESELELETWLELGLWLGFSMVTVPARRATHPY